MRLDIICTVTTTLLLGCVALDCQADELWKLVAQSHAIVIGELSPPVRQIEEAQRTGRHDYVPMPVKVTACLKGASCPTQTTLKYYTQPAPYSPSLDAVVEVQDKPAVLFLLQVDDRNSQGALYFAGYTPAALQAHSPDLEGAIRREVSRQAEIPRLLAALYDPASDPLFKRVKRLIDDTTSRRRQENAFAELKALGAKAVPAMITLMDDRRPLAIPAISLLNKSANAFEGVRHYGPEVVVEALAAVLNQVTGENFGWIYNGGTERERRLAVDGWRVYLYQSLAHTSVAAAGTIDGQSACQAPDSAACASFKAPQELSRLDSEMETIVAEIESQLPEDEKEEFPERAFLYAQRTWMVYRQATCAAEGEFTMARRTWKAAHALDCEVHFTEARVQALRQLAICLTETGQYLGCKIPH